MLFLTVNFYSIYSFVDLVYVQNFYCSIYSSVSLIYVQYATIL